MRSSHPVPRLLHVTIVSSNSETLDSLEGYLSARGVTSHGTRHIEKSSEMTPPSSSAVLIFPDDFPWAAVATALASLRRDHPSVLPVVVTSTPQRFESLTPSDGEHVAPLIIPKPVWGWTLIDTLRARLDDARSDESRKRNR